MRIIVRMGTDRRGRGRAGHLQVLIKPTVRCNATCAYCVYPGGESRRRMDEETLALTMRRLREHAEEQRLARLDVLWHGGEPLLMGNAFFERVAHHTRSFPSDLSVRHLFQTNLTVLAHTPLPAFVALVERYGALSTSFDPVDGVRTLPNGRSYARDWLKGYFMLKRRGVRINAVYVVHQKSLGRAEEIYLYFKNLGLRSLRVNPVLGVGPELAIEARQYGDFLTDLWDVWCRDERQLNVEPLASWWRLHRGAGARLACDHSGSCSSNLFCVDPQAKLYGCGRQLDAHMSPVGDLHSDTFAEAQVRKTCSTRGPALAAGACRGCQFWKYCHGGCAMDSFSEGGRFNDKTRFCASYQQLFTHAFDLPPVRRGPVLPLLNGRREVSAS